ncbi:condensation domain-containing protein [Micromonospora sp. WMMD1082]|uniref:condensation domain-containing protein n=1 Tax=Micromonospora sp. WMMD1082 TaxID=3016104 RepID=UPI002415D91F|nr:condensation domain-containing protein [Micromonospora sp. WMMD1082]MDG4794537.1 condensation domain-containing protein [Micromonospora sp. WMMD1082]
MTACPADDEPATWGQQAFRDALDRFDRHAWHTRVTAEQPVPDGLDLAGVHLAVDRVVAAHEGLRTTLVDAPGGPRQHVAPAGRVALEQVAVASPADVDAAAHELAERLRRRSDGPLSVGVVDAAGVPRRLVWALSHLAVDATSVGVLLSRPLAGGPRDDPTRPGHPGPAARQPREQAVYEAQDGYRRRSARAVAYWRARFGDLDLPLARRDRTAAGSRQAVLDSAAAATALDRVVRRLGLPSSAVVLAAVAAGLGAVHGRRVLPMQVITSNRHLPGLDRYVGVLAQPGPLVADLDPDLPFGALVEQVHGRAGTAYRHAFWSPTELDAGLRDDGRSADDVLGGICTVNDVRGAGRDPGPRPDTATATPQVRKLACWPYQGGRLAVAVAGGERALRIAMRVDPAYLDDALLPDLLHSVEAVLRRAASGGPGTPIRQLTGELNVPPAHPGQ